MPRSPYLDPILTGRRRLVYQAMAAAWLVALVWFWAWWLIPAHVDGWFRFGVITALLGWLSFLQAYFVFFLLRGVRPSASSLLSGTARVAMITTKTPSEPFPVVRRTLEAMLAQDVPHDTWLADEDPSTETLTWCAARGVKVSSRKGVAAYHQPVWPRRTRCKEGNLAFFYDRWGYRDCDFVSQLDADHVPQPGYLREILRPFADPGIGYVSAPSICASNAPGNWAARTRLHTEGLFHGALQAGYSNGFAPMCIGSHYAVRTTALRAAGGLGPELAEDHSTSLLLNAAGWRGVHAIDAIAIGDGPATLADLVTQEFQWSRSLMTLLLQYTLHYMPSLPWRLKLQFLFCQTFYPLTAMAMLAMYLTPVAAVAFDIRYAEVTYPAYLIHVAPVVLALLAIALKCRADGLFRPHDADVLAWEKILFPILQWPWVLFGCVMAVRDRITGGFVDFRITPKGEAARGRLPAKVILLYGGLALGCLLPVLMSGDLQNAQGFCLLAWLCGVVYATATMVAIWHHHREIGGGLHGFDILLHPGLSLGLVAVIALSLSARGPASVYALTLGQSNVQLVKPVYAIASASSGVGKIRYTFRPEVSIWRSN